MLHFCQWLRDTSMFISPRATGEKELHTAKHVVHISWERTEQEGQISYFNCFWLVPRHVCVLSFGACARRPTASHNFFRRLPSYIM